LEFTAGSGSDFCGLLCLLLNEADLANGGTVGDPIVPPPQALAILGADVGVLGELRYVFARGCCCCLVLEAGRSVAVSNTAGLDATDAFGEAACGKSTAVIGGL
jgi:hypothetical protein